MCQTCGCALQVQSHDHPHPHEHDHDHDHDSGDHGHLPTLDLLDPLAASRRLALGQALLNKNDRLAERNRGYFEAKGVLALNLLSSPGSGKTSIIERTLRDLEGTLKAGVIVGDLATDRDAQRIQQTGAQAVQITTGTVCHLEAEMVAGAVKQLDFTDLNLLIIENVGNLVCPADYDLGERLRVVLLSVTEGEDKPLKYPGMFKSAQIILLNKIDIAEAVGFDLALALQTLREVAPQAQIFQVSARTGAGMDAWYAYLQSQISALGGSGLNF
ncbi:MAG: hydrogenase nickel incorporation protein HypB [Cyanobacteria bacterium RI_101]|nr:hydrogenase nickel incorporation protein HypB [Cyanobacteria bacterium RI_101]